jgi:hypothetical protein|tara:strand:- start:44 stop:538 length:495 start_codon:yes stop_codon:yes gene_type:complete
MQSIEFTQEMVDQALQWANDLGGIKNSITKGRGNLAGRLGEVALANHLSVDVQDHREYDLVYNGRSIEVKTKRRTVPPLGFYEVSVAKTSKHQNPDLYAFISMEFDRKENGSYFGLKNIWLCGYSGDYFKKAKHMKKGDRDESNGFTTLVDMYNLRIDQLDKSI